MYQLLRIFVIFVLLKLVVGLISPYISDDVENARGWVLWLKSHTVVATVFQNAAVLVAAAALDYWLFVQIPAAFGRGLGSGVLYVAFSIVVGGLGPAVARWLSHGDGKYVEP